MFEDVPRIFEAVFQCTLEATFSQLFRLKESTKENVFGLDDWKRGQSKLLGLKESNKENLFDLEDWMMYTRDSLTTFRIERKHQIKCLWSRRLEDVYEIVFLLFL